MQAVGVGQQRLGSGKAAAGQRGGGGLLLGADCGLCLQEQRVALSHGDDLTEKGNSGEEIRRCVGGWAKTVICARPALGGGRMDLLARVMLQGCN